MAMTEQVPLQLFFIAGLILCFLVDIIKTKDVSYTLLNEPSNFNPVIIFEEHERFRRDVNGTSSSNSGTTQSSVTQGPSTTPFTVEVKDAANHKYYKSKALSSSGYWDELNDNPSKHSALTDGHRIAVTVGLKFEFPFYGHKIKKVTIATGGFLYMSPFLHSWLTATQYIAPLMANFDTRKGNGSDILYKDYSNRFVVEWRDVFLQDQNHSYPFVFQTTLHQNGSIVFGYRQVPLDVTEIIIDNHPVKIGVSDAYYIDATVAGITRRTIYEYHRVEVNLTLITDNTVVILEPLLTCNIAPDCETCIANSNDNFACKWCPAVSRCSDGVDWYRQDWQKKGCRELGHNNVSRCNEIYIPPTTTTQLSTTTCDPRVTKGRGRCDFSKAEKSTSPQTIGGIIAIVLVLLILIVAIVGWFVYAYRYPSTASGMWLMEHRPSVMKQKIASMKFFKRSTETGDKYKIESTTDA